MSPWRYKNTGPTQNAAVDSLGLLLAVVVTIPFIAHHIVPGNQLQREDYDEITSCGFFMRILLLRAPLALIRKCPGSVRRNFDPSSLTSCIPRFLLSAFRRSNCIAAFQPLARTKMPPECPAPRAASSLSALSELLDTCASRARSA